MAYSRRQVYLLGTGASAVGRGLELLAGLLCVWLATRMLGVDPYGHFVLALTVVEVVTLLASGGLEALVVYRSSRAPAPPGELDARELAGAGFGWALVAGALGGGGLWLGADAIGALFAKPEAGQWLGRLAPMVTIGVARNVYAAWHQGRQRIPHFVLLGHALPRLATAAALAAVYATEPAAPAIASAFVWAPLVVAVPWFLRHPVSPAHLFSGLGLWDLRYALRMSMSALLQRGVTHGDILLLGLLSTSAVTAQYAVASRIALLSLTVFTLFVPIFASRVGHLLSRDRGDDLADEYDHTRSLSLLGAVLTASAIGLLGREALALFGDFEPGLPVLLILTAAWLGQTSFGMNRAYLGVAGHAGWTLGVTALLVFGNLGLDLLLIPVWGGEGAALASLVSIVGARALTAAVIWRLDRFPTWSLRLAALTAAALALLLLAAGGRLPAWAAGLGLLPVAAAVALPYRRRWSAELVSLAAGLRR